MDATYKACDTLLSFAGIRIYSKTKWNSKLWFLIQIFCFIVGCLALVFTTGFIVQNISDVNILLKGASIWSTCIILAISLYILLFYNNQFRDFIKEIGFVDFLMEMPLIAICLRASNKLERLEELKIMVMESRTNLLVFTKKLMLGYALLVFCNSNLYLLDAVYRMIVADDPDLRLFGLQVSIAFLILEVLREMRILSHVLMNLDEIASELDSKDPEKWQKCCTDILNQCIVHYIKLKRFSNRLNVICRPFYLTLIMDSIIVVCMCSVKIAISDKLALDTVKYYALGLSFIIIVFAFCFLGQMIENECENLEKAVDEKWHIYDSKHKTHILIFKMCLRDGMTIYIFGTTPLTLPTFTWFLKTGMSFFTLVMSVLEKK